MARLQLTHLFGLAAAFHFMVGGMAEAATDPAAACEGAARVASEETGVPLAVLRAISLTETGRAQGHSLRPWPWTVNMEGEGRWFDGLDEALDYIESAVGRGALSFDIGCFQINYRWHGGAFTSVQQMFDPMANAIYAARFLSALHGELGDWSRAAGAFHSRTPEYSDRYRARFERIRAGLAEAGQPEVPPELALMEERSGIAQRPRENLYPLLRSAEPGLRGSLFPGAAAGSRPLISAPSS